MNADEVDTSPGWLMRSLEADPEYQEICRRLKEQAEAPPVVREHVDPHAEANARIRQLLNPAEEPTLI